MVKKCRFRGFWRGEQNDGLGELATGLATQISAMDRYSSSRRAASVAVVFSLVIAAALDAAASFSASLAKPPLSPSPRHLHHAPQCDRALFLCNDTAFAKPPLSSSPRRLNYAPRHHRAFFVCNQRGGRGPRPSQAVPSSRFITEPSHFILVGIYSSSNCAASARSAILFPPTSAALCAGPRRLHSRSWQAVCCSRARTALRSLACRYTDGAAPQCFSCTVQERAGWAAIRRGGESWERGPSSGTYSRSSKW